MIRVEDVSKTYVVGKERTQALSQIHLEVQEGRLFGLIGPDGAGKTSLIRILATLLLPTQGQAYLNGFHTVKDFKEIRKIVGYMPGKFSLYMDLTIQENLDFFATIFDNTIEKNYHLIKDIYTQIEPFKNRRAGQLSGGMKQKLALCCALIHKPKILLLDEPTTGVDAVSRVEFWNMLQQLKKENITILVSTPYMDEASLCDEIALIQNGFIMDVNTPQGIINTFNKKIKAIKYTDMLLLLNELPLDPEIQDIYAFGEYHHVILKNETDEYNWHEKLKLKYPNIEIKEEKASIEDCFISLMKNQNIAVS